jgi:hypothetical protein
LQNPSSAEADGWLVLDNAGIGRGFGRLSIVGIVYNVTRRTTEPQNHRTTESKRQRDKEHKSTRAKEKRRRGENRRRKEPSDGQRTLQTDLSLQTFQEIWMK